MQPQGAATDGRYLVRMLYNEKETPFKAACRPVSKGSAFYDLDALERCFGRDAQAGGPGGPSLTAPGA